MSNFYSEEEPKVSEGEATTTPKEEEPEAGEEKE